ncbi:MAG: FAD-binding oxidoreductase [Trueperaceae bacterium]|nr:FAD-binding oxidoreductase [Trueperaceae bacterium]
MNISIIGAGIIGLSTAIKLLEAGFDVTILSKSTTPNTTSDIAAAYWAASDLLADEQKRTLGFAARARLLELAQTPESGIRQLPLLVLSQADHKPDLWETLPDVRELPSGQFAPPWNHGFSFTTFQFDVPTYMPFLYQHLEKLGGKFVSREVKKFEELDADVMINCTGLGAKALVADDDLYPIRGQIMRLSRPDDFPEQIITAEDASQVSYIVPRIKDVILGGTYQHHRDDEAVDQKTADAIWERCLTLEPALSQAKLLEHRVGIRPGRPLPRLERDPHQANLIHNYGHGSLGHTLAWGCAERVLEIVKSL